VLDNHLDQKNQGAQHVNGLNPNIVDSAGLQVDNHRIHQDDRKNKFVVEKEIFGGFHKRDNFSICKNKKNDVFSVSVPKKFVLLTF
jgi:hypothetical protein